MVRLNTMELLRLSGHLHALAEAYGDHGVRAPRELRADFRERTGLLDAAARLLCCAQNLGLTQTVDAANRGIAAANDDLAGSDVGRIAGQIAQTLEIEVAAVAVIALPAERAAHLGDRAAFGDAVYQWLPAARQDIAEASNCLAFSLFTAAAFHCMRAVELALRREAVWTKAKTWAACAEGLRARADAEEPDAKAFWRETADTFDLFRRAWRNGTMHADLSYGEEEAAEVFAAARGFLRRLAEGVSRK